MHKTARGMSVQVSARPYNISKIAIQLTQRQGGGGSRYKLGCLPRVRAKEMGEFTLRGDPSRSCVAKI